MAERLPSKGESPYYDILVPWLQVANNADGTPKSSALLSSLAGSALQVGSLNATSGDVVLKSNSAAIRQRNFGNSADVAILSLSGTSADDLLLGNGIAGLAAVTAPGGLKVQPAAVAAGLFLIRHGSLAASSYLTSLIDTNLFIGTNNTDAIKITGAEQAVFHLGGAVDSVSLPGLGLENRRILSWKGVSGGYGDSAFIWYSASNNLAFGVNNTTQVILAVNGALQLLNARNATTDVAGYLVQANNTQHAWLDSAGGTTNRIFITGTSNNDLRFGTGGSTVVIIDVGGSVSFGHTVTGALGELIIPNTKTLSGVVAAGGAKKKLIGLDASDRVQISPDGQDILWGKALVALGGGAAPTLGTIGGTGPAAAAQNSWMRVIDSTGAAFWVPAWK